MRSTRPPPPAPNLGAHPNPVGALATLPPAHDAASLSLVTSLCGSLAVARTRSTDAATRAHRRSIHGPVLQSIASTRRTNRRLVVADRRRAIHPVRCRGRGGPPRRRAMAADTAHSAQCPTAQARSAQATGHWSSGPAVAAPVAAAPRQYSTDGRDRERYSDRWSTRQLSPRGLGTSPVGNGY